MLGQKVSKMKKVYVIIENGGYSELVFRKKKKALKYIREEADTWFSILKPEYKKSMWFEVGEDSISVKDAIGYPVYRIRFDVAQLR